MTKIAWNIIFPPSCCLEMLTSFKVENERMPWHSEWNSQIAHNHLFNMCVGMLLLGLQTVTLTLFILFIGYSRVSLRYRYLFQRSSSHRDCSRPRCINTMMQVYLYSISAWIWECMCWSVSPSEIVIIKIGILNNALFTSSLSLKVTHRSTNCLSVVKIRLHFM